MKLLIIAPELYPVPHAKGTSVETCIYHIARNWAKKHTVTVISRANHRYSGIKKQGKITYIYVPAGSKKRYIANVLSAIKDKQYDHIQIDNRPEFIGRVKKDFPQTPISLFLHSLTYVTPPKASFKRVRAQLSHADIIVTNSRSLQTELTKYYAKHRHKMKVVHLGVDTAQFRPPARNERLITRSFYRASHTFSIVYVGRILPSKGIHVLIRAADQAARSIPNLKLYIIGTGKRKYIRYLRRLAAKSRANISFIAPLPRTKVHRAYWLADCIVYPSQSFEAFGLVAIEALSSRVPAIVSKNGGLREIVKHHYNGLVVQNYSSAAAFAKPIIKLAHNRNLTKKLGQNGRITCLLKFNWRKASERLIRIYQNLQ